MGQTAEGLRQQLEQQREEVGRDLEAIGDRVSPGRMVERRKVAVRQSFGRARQAVMGTADGAQQAASDRASAVGDRVGSATGSVSSAVSSATGAVGHAPEALMSQAQGNPLAAGLIAFGAGALIGSLMPASRKEQDALRQVQPALESAATEVRDAVEAVTQELGSEAAEAAERLKDSALEAAEAVTSEGQSAGEATMQKATEAVQAVRPT